MPIKKKINVQELVREVNKLAELEHKEPMNRFSSKRKELGLNKSLSWVTYYRLRQDGAENGEATISLRSINKLVEMWVDRDIIIL